MTIHGSFWQTPDSHLQGSGCPECGKIKANVINIKNRKTTEQFIKEARLVHGDKYDYSKVVYVHTNTKVEIICPIHGSFWQQPIDHLHGHGCLECGNLTLNKSHDLFIQQVKKIHKDRIIILGTYKSKRTKIKMKCTNCGSVHDIFPKNLLDGNACYNCQQSKGEIFINDILKDNDVGFETQWHFNKHKDLKGSRGYSTLKFDFFLPDHNLCIEYDGNQHFQPVKHWGGMEKLIRIQKRDQIKNQFCLDNNIRLVRIPHWVKPTNELILQLLEEKFTVRSILK